MAKNFSDSSVYLFIKIHKKAIFKVSVVVLIFLISFTVFALKSNNKKSLEIQLTNSNNNIEVMANENEVAPADSEIVIHIAGEVVNSGVYRINKNARLEDVINLAGGFTEEAYQENLNLARKMTDGEKLVVYSKDDIEKQGDSENSDKSVYKSDIMGKYNNIDLININTASLEELQTLKGVGPKTAKKIVDYRNENLFSNKEEILKVDGIGQKTYEKFKDKITTF